MKSLKILTGVVCTCLLSSAQVPEVRPQVAGRAVQEGQVTVVYLAPRFATAIRMPDAVSSVVLGEGLRFGRQYSETCAGAFHDRGGNHGGLPSGRPRWLWAMPCLHCRTARVHALRCPMRALERVRFRFLELCRCCPRILASPES